jgi:hypothetical protein
MRFQQKARHREKGALTMQVAGNFSMTVLDVDALRERRLSNDITNYF